VIDREGQFVWEEENFIGGIRQDVSESTKRYRNLQNVHLFNEGALTKDRGIRPLTSSAINSASYSAGKDVLAGFDAQFSAGQKVVVIQEKEGASSADMYVYGSGAFATPQNRTIAENIRPDLVMFADKLHVIDGTELKASTYALDGSGSWTSPGDSTYADPCTIGTVYANRLILSGSTSATYKNHVFPSGVRDSTTWDPNIAIQITNISGDTVSCLGTIGSNLIIGGRTFIRSYYLGTGGATDWDYDEVSNLIGPSSHKSFVSIPSTHGKVGLNLAMFWTAEGPMMLMKQGQSSPQLINIGSPIVRSVRGEDFQGVGGLDVDSYGDVQGVYVPEYDEVRFAVRTNDYANQSGTQHDILYCCNITSAINYAQGTQGVYPYWRIRSNKASNSVRLPVNTLFSARIHPTTHLPDSNGVIRCLCAQDGFVYEMDASNQFVDKIKDTDYNIRMVARRDGYDGLEDGVRNNIKSLRSIYTRNTRSGIYTLKIKVVADGGSTESSANVDLSGGSGFGYWGDGREWGDGSLWNAGDFINSRAQFGILGRKFDIELFDNGEIASTFQTNSFSMIGYVEDRR
jgi:hypothetical protein